MKHKINQMELIVLAVRENALTCRLMKTDEKVTLRLSSFSLYDIAPGEIVAIEPNKQWNFKNHNYISGKLINHRIDIFALKLTPLKIKKYDDWDPLEMYEDERDEFDEPIEETDEYYKTIIKAGKRVGYEMEQVVPGDTDLSADGPILDAIYYKDIGEIGIGQKILMNELVADLRCLDAHAHLGNFIYKSWPQHAITHYKIGILIGELSLPKNFNGVLLWADIDNRPFLRCMHGYGLCLWRLEQYDKAEKVFERMLWLNPPDNQGARFNINRVKDKIPWREDI